ncbi:hypothetical protein TSMG0117 [Halocynthia phage JM-2012]|uniref:terminase large subunit n=1 Tax=Halocynthia phage JM-2012 TaxID=1173297 RepID=UPI00025C6949|nr:terminase large subunit [Halocynthia phage JM-2012]AFI55400.1 hypothetical protein TSMG0117 [Halocynthia phage JM-2012]
MAILFEADWDKYPTAIIHNSTKNKSWRRMAFMYRDGFGIKNYKWPLALINPTLEHVDPHSKDLTDRQKLDIIHECSINPWYFYREVLLIPAKIGIQHNKFRVDRGTLATLWCYHNHIDSTNIQLRQTGKTIKIEGVAIWLITVGTFNTTVLYGTIDRSKQTDCVRSIKEKLSILPDYIYSPVKGKDYDNQVGVSNVRRKNYIEFAIGQKDKRVATSAGRGYSLANKIWDEVAEMINAHLSIGAASNSSNAVIDQARELDEPYGSIFACTAGSLDRVEGQFYHGLANSGMSWNEILLDCINEEDLRETVGANSKDRLAPLVDITMSWRQLGIKEERFREIIALSKREANGDMDKVKRECYSIWSRGSVSNPLDKKQIETIFNSECEPDRHERTKEKVIVRWYRSAEVISRLADDGKIGIGVDTSQGVNKDACSVTISNLANLEVIGRADISKINLRTYADFISKLLISIPNSLLVIENKASGQAIIDACILALHAIGEDPFERIYNNIYQDPERYSKAYETIQNTPMRKRSVEFYNEYKGLFGFSTNAQLRQRLYDEVLTESVKYAASVIRDRTLSGQLRVLEEKNGRVDHPSGGHDDAVISWLLINWFCLYGRNHKKYSISGQYILSEAVSTEDGNYDEAEYQRQQEINYLTTIIPTLEEEYRLNYDTMYGISIKDKIVKVYDRLEMLGSTAKNIDQLLNDLKEEGKRNKKMGKRR